MVFPQMWRGVSESTESTDEDDLMVTAALDPLMSVDVRWTRLDDAGDAPTEDFFAGEEALGDGYVPDYASPNSPMDGAEGQGEGEHEGGGAAGGEYNDFDPQRGPGGGLTMAEAGPGKLMFDYFDETVRRNWEGPQHWKMRGRARKRMI